MRAEERDEPLEGEGMPDADALIEFYRRCMDRLPAAAIRLVRAVEARTWAAGKRKSPISTREFIADTGMAERTIQMLVRRARESGLAIVRPRFEPGTLARAPSEFALNPDWDGRWEEATDPDPPDDDVKKRTPTPPGRGPKQRPDTSGRQTNQDHSNRNRDVVQDFAPHTEGSTTENLAPRVAA